MRLIWVLLLCQLPELALAGPWLRQIDRGFSSAQFSISGSKDGKILMPYSAAYLEFGASDQTTLVFTIDQSSSGDRSIFVRAKRALKQKSGGWNIAYDLGLGGISTGTDLIPALRAELTVGKGFSYKERDGWMTLDTSVVLYEKTKPASLKLQGTVGLTMPSRNKIMMQVFAEVETAGNWQFGIEPAITFPIARNRHIKLSASSKSYRAETIGFGVGFWSEF